MTTDNRHDLSIIITAHNEGLVTHKTVLSVLDAVELLEKDGISYEIIVSMDNPNRETEDYYKQYETDRRFRIIKASYHNVSDSRNNAIKLANGDYVALLDGDDLISQNFFIDAYVLAKKQNGPVVLRPNAQLQFGVDEEKCAVWILEGSLDKEKDTLIMTQFNKWPSALVASRDIFGKLRFVPATKGYGYEDYQFNAEMIYEGIPQLIVPETTFFYRRRSSGKQYEHVAENTLLPYTRLFDFDFIKSMGMSQSPHSRQTTVALNKLRSSVTRSVGRAVKLGKALAPIQVKQLLKPTVYRIIKRSYSKMLPDWLIAQWKGINHIENQLWPTADTISKLDYHMLSFNQDGEFATRVGRAYQNLVRQFTKKPDYIFFTYDPLGAGGTEKVLLNYIKAIKKSHPDWHLAIFRKRPEKLPFEVPEGVDFIDFFGETNKMHDYEVDILLDRLIVQSQTKRLHFFFNGWASGDVSYNWVRQHRKFLHENNYITNISWFMNEFVIESEKGRISSFADPYLLEIYDAVNRVFTDNKTIIDASLANNAFDPAKFAVHYQPVEMDNLTPPKRIDSRKPLRILWAGRLSFQKRPDILRDIARRLDPHKFHIDIYGREQHYNGRYFSGIPALTYRGEFSGFSSLPVEDYDVLLYTSQVDGLPNVLLEATVAGLPVVASNDGGVGELVIDGKTGKLVNIEDIDNYVRALEYIKGHPGEATSYVEEAQKLLKKHHTAKRFEDAVEHDIR